MTHKVVGIEPRLRLAKRVVDQAERPREDAAEWLPRLNPCWFAQAGVEVPRAYGVTIDQGDAEAGLR